MRTMKRRKAAESLGVDAADGALRLAGFARGSVVFEEACASAPADLAARLADGVSCAAAAAPATCLLIALQPPDLPEAKLARILPSLLDVQLPLPLSECQYAFTRQGATRLAHAVRHPDLRQRIEALAQAGCNPARIVPPALAAWSQALAEIPPATDAEPRALFLCGAAQTLLVTGRGAALERQTVFKTDPAEFPKRLRLACGGLPDGLVCILAGPAHASAAEGLRAALGSDAARLTTARAPEFLLARSLAADAARAGRGDDANLRTGAFAHPALIRKQARPLFRLAAVLAVSAAILFPLAGLVLARAQRQARAAETAFERAVDELAGYDVKTRGERAVQDARAGLAAQLDPAVVAYRDHAVVSRLNRLAALAAQSGTTLHHLALDARSLTASGTAASAEKADAFVQLLAGAGFQTVMSEIPKTASDGTVQFFIHTPQP